MRTLTLEQPGRFVMHDTPAPAPEPALGSGLAVVRVRKVGVCGTDLHAYRGEQPFLTYPRILGHELGVEVLAVAPGVTGIRAGDRCCVLPYLHCGRCIACRRGKTNCCVSLQVLGVHVDGGMRESIVVPAAHLFASRKLSDDQLALVETLGIGAHAVGRAALEPGETVLVVGAGPIGLSVVQFALLEGARVIVMDLSVQRLTFCREKLGVTDTIVAGDPAAKQLAKLTGGDLPTAVFDATGNVKSEMAALDDVAPGGRIVLVGLSRGSISYEDALMHRKEIALLRSRNSTAADFRRILGLIEAGRIDTRPWITHRAALTDVIAQFPTWLDPSAGVIKAMIEV